MLGYAPEEARRLKWQDITHPDDLESTGEIVDSILSGRRDSARFTKRYLHKDGRPIWADVSTVIRRDGNGRPLYFVTAISNITERIKAEEALRENESRFRGLFDTMAEMVVLHEEVRDEKGAIIDYRVLDANPAFSVSTGLAREEVRGRLASGLYGTAEAPYLDIYAEVLESGRPAEFEAYFSPLDRYYTVSAIRLSPGRFATVTMDITERKRAEEEIRRSLGEKETLLREVYHRTKNNMNVIASMLALRARATAEPAAAEVCRDMQDRIRAMALVHQRLYESRDLSSIDLKDYIDTLAANLVKSHREQAAELRIVMDLEPVVVPIDIAIPCGMILNELFSNAFKHAFPGGRAGTIRLRLKRAERDEIEIVFSDDGARVPVGFDPRAQARLGLRTLFMLVEHQLQGSVAFEAGTGLTCRIRFAAKPPGTEPLS
jgi:PAS domain S-box-containing protein